MVAPADGPDGLPVGLSRAPSVKPDARRSSGHCGRGQARRCARPARDNTWCRFSASRS